MGAVLSSEIDTYGSNRPNKNSASQRYSFGVIQISIWNSDSKKQKNKSRLTALAFFKKKPFLSLELGIHSLGSVLGGGGLYCKQSQKTYF